MGFALQTDLARLERAPQEVARWHRARQQLQAGRPALALPAYQELVKQFPGVVNLWFELGVAAAADLNFSRAAEALEQARRLAIHDPSLLIMLGQQFHRLRRQERARACFQSAVEADPSSTHARLSWAAWLERENHLKEAGEQTDACLARNARDPAALYYRAFLLHRQNRDTDAETILRDLLRSEVRDPDVRISCLHLLGVVLDEQSQYAGALECLLQAKEALRGRQNVAALQQAYDKAARQREILLAKLTAEMVRRWRQESPPAPAGPMLVLLGGHPRSGTTLLEQILGAHPAIAAFDESEAFMTEVGDKLAPPPPAAPLKLAALNSISSSRRGELRSRYFKSLQRETEGEVSASVLLDKNPSPTASLHLWLRVFPESKIIIALRDPRDVVLSCFFQNLALTQVNVNFLSLERSVQHYKDMMDVWLRLRDLGGFDGMETRYEDVVANVEKEGRRITALLGLEWHECQGRSHEAAQRKLIFSPTYSDVAKPLHNRAVGRWKHYEAALQPWQGELGRYGRAFGYDGQ
ncbi:MAG: sulfotransferase [Limisphaerales bacterium]